MADNTEMRLQALDLATDLVEMGKCDRSKIATIKTCCQKCLVEIVSELINNY